MESLSTVGTWIGAALAISTQPKPLAAEATANAPEAFRMSRRLNSICHSRGIHAMRRMNAPIGLFIQTGSSVEPELWIVAILRRFRKDGFGSMSTERA